MDLKHDGTRDGRRLSRRLGLALLVVACAEQGCARHPRPQPPARPPAATSERVAPPPAVPANAPPPERGEAPQASGAAPVPPLTIVIDDPAPDPAQTTLLEASRLAREKQKTAGPPVAIITNENLAEYAKRGNLTLAQPTPQAPAPAPRGTEPAEDPAPPVASSVKDEAYWRDGARSLREKWRRAADELNELMERTQTLRQQFYSEEDPYYRDSRIKPVWDRALDRLEEVKREAQESQELLAEFLEEGRRNEALPGWLREGIELEPETPPEKDPNDLRTAEPSEPSIIDEDPPRP